MDAPKNILMYDFPASQYFAQEFPKTQIVLHHTAGNANALNTFKGWEMDTIQVATCISVSGKGAGATDGQIVQGYSSKYWAWHLGLQTKVFQQFGLPYLPLDKSSIGIEICNWGPVTKTARGWETYVGTVIPDDQVVEYTKPFKGYQHYHKYTAAQIESVRQLLLYWGERYGISLDYHEDIWDLCPRALKNDKGIFLHVSYRADKSDLHPQPEMITMLKGLKT